VQTAGRIGEIKGEISALMSALSHLAPHPDRPGPVFICSTSGIGAPADYEGMLGSVLLESLVGSVFNDMAGGGSTAIDPGALMDAGGEYLKDRAQEAHTDLRGRGSFAVCPHKTSCNSFGGIDPHRRALMDAFMADLPERMALESRVAADERDLSVLKYREAHEYPVYDA
jgi:hypothetical protein